MKSIHPLLRWREVLAQEVDLVLEFSPQLKIVPLGVAKKYLHLQPINILLIDDYGLTNYLSNLVLQGKPKTTRNTNIVLST